MNRTYALIWNHALGAWTVAHEHARKRGKGAGAVMAASLVLAGSAFAADLPTGGQVVSGSGAINQPNANQMVIDQASNKLAIDWQSFDIGSGNKVTFNQPGTDSIALNRVLGADGSKIMGQLDANGRVFIINPNGVLFGAGAQVNVGGLVASTLDISNSDFEAGNYRFKGDGSNASIINNGRIIAADGGSVALLGGTVSNNGVIVANQGTVALAAGNAATLDFAGDGLLSVQVDEAVKDALVENRQLIQADGGNVILTASAADALLQTVVNNDGVIQARTLGEKEGRIVLLGDFDGGTVQVAGTLDASAADGGNGGFIDTSGAHVQIAEGTTVTTKATTGQTGTWLIDPTDFTVSAGSASQTTSGIGATTLSANLQNTSVTLQTVAGGSENGDINVNAAVAWDADTALTLNAHGDIHINAAITATGESAGLHLNHGGYVQNGSVAAGTDYHVKAPVTLSGANASLSINGNDYTLIRSMEQLDALDVGVLSVTGHYALAHDLHAGGITFTEAPINRTFRGTFAGLGHAIHDLTIKTDVANPIGLFNNNGTGVIRDFALLGVNLKGVANVGSVAGLNGGRIRNVHATGAVSGRDNLGGLVGRNEGSAHIEHAYAAVDVKGDYVGGGLVGLNSGSIKHAYATGSLEGYLFGGIVGYNDGGGSIDTVYASGALSGSDLGGLVGENSGSIENAYWDSTSTGQNTAYAYNSGSISATAITSANRYSRSSYTDLGTWALVPGTGNVYAASDANGVQWIMIEGQTRPFLASEYSTTIRNAHQLQLMAYDLSAHYLLANDIDAGTTAGSNPSGMWSSAGFSPVGSNTNSFIGVFDGRGHTISGLAINRASATNIGLFGLAGAGSVIRDVGLLGGSVVGDDNTGGLVGRIEGGAITNAYTTGSVTGGLYVGGLVGYAQGSAITDAHTTGPTTGRSYVAGLVGGSVSGSIMNAHATGSVATAESSSAYVGGLVAYNAGNIGSAYATGTVTVETDGDAYVGGLVGRHVSGSIENAYASGDVLVTSLYGNVSVGGLVGISASSITNVYASGDVAGNGGFFSRASVGGLVGNNYHGISNAYATGNVTGTAMHEVDVGGIAGRNFDDITASFYATTNAAGNPINQGRQIAGRNPGTATVTLSGGKTHDQLTTLSTFTDAGWDISDQGGDGTVWRIYDGHSTPLLRSFLTALTVNAGTPDTGKTYDGNIANGTAGYTTDLGTDLNPAWINGTLVYATQGAAAGIYRTADGTLTLGGLYSSQQGYDITYAPRLLEIRAEPTTTPETPAVQGGGYAAALVTAQASLPTSASDEELLTDSSLNLEVAGSGITLPEGI